MPGGPVVIAFDGSPSAEHAVREAGALLSGRRALVLSVWTPGVGWEAVELPAASMGLPPAALDVNAALDVDHAMLERAQRVARHGAVLADEAGFEAEPLVTADEPGRSVAETIIKVARERGAQAILVGAHGHGRVAEVMLGSTSRDLIRHADCPVVVVRQ
jgi:nucleotide-binding universal stress UspA family protein